MDPMMGMSDMMGGGPPMGSGAPSMMNPGGDPAGGGDPLSYGLNVCISSLKKCAQEAQMRGDETTANMLDAMAVKLVKIKLNRQKAIDGAAEKGALTVGAQNL